MLSGTLFLLALLLPTLAIVLASDEARAFFRGTGSIKQTMSNAGVGGVFLLVQLSLRGVALGLFAAVDAAVPWQLPQLWWAYPIAFVFLDAVYYMQHRLEHSVPLLWAIHAVHHQSLDYNLSVSLRVGALATVSTVFFHALIALLGVSTAQYAAVLVVHGVLLFGLHARTRFTLGPGRFFNAPVFHRIHHGTAPQHIDRNFGGVFLVFDRIFGTFAPFDSEPTYGTVSIPPPSEPLGANAAPFAKLWRSIMRQPTRKEQILALFRKPPRPGAETVSPRTD